MTANEKYTIVFVCTGNTCRSPMAEGVLRTMIPENLAGRVEVVSAGIAAVAGKGVTPLSVEVAGRRGIDLSSGRSRPFTADLARRADLVVCMESSHRRVAASRGGKGKVILLGELLPPSDPMFARDVPDPFGGTPEEYEETFRRIHRALTSGWPLIEKWLGETSHS